MMPYKTIKIKDLWNEIGKSIGGNDLGDWMEYAEKNPGATIEEFRKLRLGNKGYRDDPIGKFENPTPERINKVFPEDYWEFDNVIGLRTDYNVGFMSEDDLQKYIDIGLSGEAAMDYYYDELDRLMLENIRE